MGAAQVNKLFNACPFKDNIPKALVNDFKRDCLHDVRELWADKEKHLPPVLGTTCFIPVSKVVNQRPVPCHNPEKLEAFREILQSMVDRGIIVPSSSPYNSPAFLVPKKSPKSDSANDRWRLVNDMSAINEFTADHRNCY